MKSFIAALRVLVLPFGATTGRRIVLDGVNGVIQFYDTNNVLRMELGRLADTVELYSGLTGEDEPAELASFGLDAAQAFRQAALRLRSPQFAAPNDNNSSIELYSEAADGTLPAKIELETDRFELSPKTIADGIEVALLGTLTASAKLFIGGGTTFPSVDIVDGVVVIESGGDITIGGESLPRGIVSTIFDDGANDAARAAGVNTNMAVTMTADATRLYKVHTKFQFNGSAAGIYAANLIEGGTVGANDGTLVDRFQRWSAAEMAAGSLTGHCQSAILYQPTAGAKTLRVENDAGSAGTMTQTGSANVRRQMWVEDIGAR
jgi:hypothetical protein